MINENKPFVKGCFDEEYYDKSYVVYLLEEYDEGEINLTEDELKDLKDGYVPDRFLDNIYDFYDMDYDDALDNLKEDFEKWKKHFRYGNKGYMIYWDLRRDEEKTEVVDYIDIENLLKNDIFRILDSNFQYFGFCWNGDRDKFKISINCQYGNRYCYPFDIYIYPFEVFTKSDLLNDIISLINDYCERYTYGRYAWYDSINKCYNEILGDRIGYILDKDIKIGNYNNCKEYWKNILSKLSKEQLFELYSDLLNDDD